MPSVHPTRDQLEQAASFAYLYCLERVEAEIGSEVTKTNTLTRVGQRVFGPSFIGVYARDTFPFQNLSPGDKGIINTDRSDQEGTHWVAIARGITEPDKVYVYDTFGRKGLIPAQSVQPLPPGTHLSPTDDDAEQKDSEDNCGARCLAWLCVYEELGEFFADLI
jgi:hypothetical protein